MSYNKEKFKFIAVGTLKGGVGKSTAVVSIASILAKEGCKVLVIDMDPQANTSTYLGLDETINGYKGILDVFENRQIPPMDVINSTIIENLDIIGSTILLTSTEKKFITKSFAEQQLKKYIDRNLDFFNKYDYIIADTNPSMSKINQNAFIAADKILCISDVGIGAHKGIELFDYLLSELAEESELDLKINAILLNKFKARNNLSKEYKEYLEDSELTKKLLLNTVISDSVKIAEAELEQKPINIYAPKCKIANEYIEVIRELKQREVL